MESGRAGTQGIQGSQGPKLPARSFSFGKKFLALGNSAPCSSAFSLLGASSVRVKKSLSVVVSFAVSSVDKRCSHDDGDRHSSDVRPPDDGRIDESVVSRLSAGTDGWESLRRGGGRSGNLWSGKRAKNEVEMKRRGDEGTVMTLARNLRFSCSRKGWSGRRGISGILGWGCAYSARVFGACVLRLFSLRRGYHLFSFTSRDAAQVQ